MSTLLLVNSSILGDHSISAQLADSFSQQWLAANPGGTVMTRDVAEDQVPHLDNELVNAIRFVKPEERNEKQQQQAAYSDQLINEVKAADAIVITAPMYNFGIPSTLKAWIDHIARAGTTFKYTENGPVGLLKNKTAVVMAARGGVYKDTPNDTQTPYLKTLLGFVGIEKVHFIYAEKLSMGDDGGEAVMTEAKQQIEKLIAQI